MAAPSGPPPLTPEELEQHDYWRCAGPEEIPKVDWGAPGMPFYKAVPDWFTDTMTWAEYNEYESRGEGLSAWFLGRCDKLQGLARGLGYPYGDAEGLWKPYQVWLAVIEEDRTIRNEHGHLQLRPTRSFNHGHCGPYVSELVHRQHAQGRSAMQPRAIGMTAKTRS